MKNTARFLARLYPAGWRARYGEELEALLEDSSAGFGSSFDLLKGAVKMQLSLPSFPKLALFLSFAGILAGFGVSFLVTPTYVSEAVMEYEVSPAGSTANGIGSALREHVMASQNEVLSRTSLKFLIEDPRLDLYPEERAKWPLEDVIEKMRTKDLKITALGERAPAAGDVGYLPVEISFAYRDPHKAQQAVQVLLTRFQESNLTRQRQPAALNRQRSTEQVARLEARITVLEKRLGIAPGSSEPAIAAPVEFAVFNLGVVDAPTLPQLPAKPNRVVFMAGGLAAGMAAALVIAIFRRRPPPIPFPAELA